MPGPLQTRHGVGVAACAASRSPLVQYASPSSAAAAAAREVVVLVGEVERPPGVRHRAGDVAADQGQAGAVHRDRAGSVRNSSSSTTTIVGVARSRRRVAATARRRRRRASTPSSSPRDHERADVAHAQHGPARNSSSGSASSQPRSVASCRLLRMAGDRQLDQVRRALEVPAGQRVVDRLGPFAVLLVPVARPPVQLADAGRAARPAGAPAARRRRGGGSGTSGGGRRAGPGTGSPDRAPRAWPCRRPGR